MTMNLQVRLFATLKDRAGKNKIEITLSEPATVKTLLETVAHHYPSLEPALPTVLVAVNKAFASPDTPIQPGDEIALFPPVSGGSDMPHPTYFAITSEPLDVNTIYERLARPDVGAIATFTGFVRGETRREGLPTETLYLEYEAYTEMAELKMAQIAREIWERWPKVKGIAIVQRIGKLDIGEVTTFVACAAGHRDQGIFEAARYGIDRLKEIVPVWKKEVGQDRSVWVEGHYRPTEADNE
ncbi:MAG: MoaD family protein [Chloroflexi bacterium]|nr:MAG: MoaD family protein [Chloroflexota bacterium]